MPALCPLLSLASLILHLAGAPIPAITCLSLALIVLPPVQCLVKLAVALVMALIVGAVDLVLRLIRGSDRFEDSLLMPTPATPGPSAGLPPVPRGPQWRGQARPTGELAWQGQASPFLDHREKRSGRGRR